MKYFPSLLAGRSRARAATDAARAEIEAAIAQANEAFARGDADGILRWVAPDYRCVDCDGSALDRAAAERRLRESLAALDEPGHRTRVRSIVLHESTAILTVEEETLGLLGGAPFSCRQTCEDTWSRVAHGWQIRLSRCLWQSAVADFDA